MVREKDKWIVASFDLASSGKDGIKLKFMIKVLNGWNKQKGFMKKKQS